MDKINPINPLTPAITGHRVIISDKVFSEIIKTINLQSEAINTLIENQNMSNEMIEKLDASIKNLANAIRNL